MWRLATPSDDDVVVEMCLGLYREDPGPLAGGARPVRETLELLRREPWRGRTAALEWERQVVGYALLIAYWSNELGGEVCNVDELYVRPAHRGQGHARKLLVALAGASPLWPGTPVAVELEVSPANTGAAALYASLGFRPVRNRHLRLRTGEG